MPREDREKKKVILPFSFLIIPFVFLADRLSKAAVTSHFAEGGGFSIFPGIFHITRVNNTGAAFGIMRGGGIFLIAISFFCVLTLLAYLFNLFRHKNENAPHFIDVLPWALIAAGALGNLYDRIYYGYVIDFLDFRVWPVFNVADISITAGVLLVVLNYFFKIRTTEKV